jgi:hypothetical protein
MKSSSDTIGIWNKSYVRVGVTVGMVTRLRDWMFEESFSIPGSDKIFICSPKRPDLFWATPSLLLNRYEGLFLVGKADGT